MVQTLISCPCGSSALFSQCCEPFLLDLATAKTAEQLMRSRFCAYVTSNYRYILETYSPEKQQSLSINALQQSDSNSEWLKLIVHNHHAEVDSATVEFSAFYRFEEAFHVMHEVSNFTLLDTRWYYTNGRVLPDSGIIKLARNEPCLCGSGKKYKQCCL